jgi:ubiquinone/menaquinone biosynthesis C-methylase UbiE
MREKDEVAIANERHWDRMVKEGCGFTIPWLDLDPDIIRRYAKGELDTVPKNLTVMTPHDILADVEGKDVLCLSAGGGQQSAVFGVLGARVTVVDLARGQLEADRKAAEHYGYEITTIHSDMRDLSCPDDESFDMVYGTAICYVPDTRQVYSEVARVLRPGGVYRVDFHQPAVHFVACDGDVYRIARPYCEKIDRREDGAIEFRHYMDDIFNGLIEVGLSIRQVVDLSRNKKPDLQAPPGSWMHEEPYIGGRFVIVATKDKRVP